MKYWIDLKKRKRFPMNLFAPTYLVKKEAVEDFRRTNGRLPKYVHAIATPAVDRPMGSFIERVLIDKSSIDLRELIADLPSNNELAIGKFCDRYELGNCFYESMLLNAVEITDSLRLICNQKELEELRTEEDQREISRDLRVAQGARH